MTLAVAEFIRRFLIHVLPSGFHRIRHYGLFASGARAENIARSRELLAARAAQSPQNGGVNAATAKRRARCQPLSASLPVLRRPHDRHRDIRTRGCAQRSASPAHIRIDTS